MHSARTRLAALAAVAFALLVGSSAGAAPLTVNLTGVSATVTVELGGTLIGSTGAPLAVTGGSLVFDPALLTVDSFSVALTGGASSLITLSSAVDIGLGAFDQILVNSALLTSIASASYPATELIPLVYQFQGVPGVVGDPVAAVTSSLTLSNSGGGSPLNQVLPFGISTLTGSLVFAGLNPGDVLDFGIAFPIASFTTTTGEILQMKADLLITGTVVPEPSAALLMGIALASVSLRVRAGRRG